MVVGPSAGVGKWTGRTAFVEHSDDRDIPLFLLTTSMASAVGSGNLDTPKRGMIFPHYFSRCGD